jgi:hypothetical protein
VSQSRQAESCRNYAIDMLLGMCIAKSWLLHLCGLSPSRLHESHQRTTPSATNARRASAAAASTIAINIRGAGKSCAYEQETRLKSCLYPRCTCTCSTIVNCAPDTPAVPANAREVSSCRLQVTRSGIKTSLSSSAYASPVTSRTVVGDEFRRFVDFGNFWKLLELQLYRRRPPER